MRFLPALSLAFLAAACAKDDDRPTGPGGGGGGGGGGTDSPDASLLPDGMPSGGIEGRLCLVNDMRNPSLCPTLPGLGGIEIENTNTGDKTTSEDDGSFTLPPSEGSIAKIRVAFNDTDFTNVLIPVGLSGGAASGVELPLVRDLVWQDLLLVVGINEPAGTASLATYFVGGPSGVSIEAPSGSSGVPIYDGPLGPNDWGPGGGTGSNGAAIVVGVPAGNPNVSILATPFESASQTVNGIPVESNVLTFITVALP